MLRYDKTNKVVVRMCNHCTSKDPSCLHEVRKKETKKKKRVGVLCVGTNHLSLGGRDVFRGRVYFAPGVTEVGVLTMDINWCANLLVSYS